MAPQKGKVAIRQPRPSRLSSVIDPMPGLVRNRHRKPMSARNVQATDKAPKRMKRQKAETQQDSTVERIAEWMTQENTLMTTTDLAGNSYDHTESTPSTVSVYTTAVLAAPASAPTSAPANTLAIAGPQSVAGSDAHHRRNSDRLSGMTHPAYATPTRKRKQAPSNLKKVNPGSKTTPMIDKPAVVDAEPAGPEIGNVTPRSTTALKSLHFLPGWVAVPGLVTGVDPFPAATASSASPNPHSRGNAASTSTPSNSSPLNTPSAAAATPTPVPPATAPRTPVRNDLGGNTSLPKQPLQPNGNAKFSDPISNKASGRGVGLGLGKSLPDWLDPKTLKVKPGFEASRLQWKAKQKAFGDAYIAEARRQREEREREEVSRILDGE